MLLSEYIFRFEKYVIFGLTIVVFKLNNSMYVQFRYLEWCNGVRCISLLILKVFSKRKGRSNDCFLMTRLESIEGWTGDRAPNRIPRMLIIVK